MTNLPDDFETAHMSAAELADFMGLEPETSGEPHYGLSPVESAKVDEIFGFAADAPSEGVGKESHILYIGPDGQDVLDHDHLVDLEADHNERLYRPKAKMHGL